MGVDSVDSNFNFFFIISWILHHIIRLFSIIPTSLTLLITYNPIEIQLLFYRKRTKIQSISYYLLFYICTLKKKTKKKKTRPASVQQQKKTHRWHTSYSIDRYIPSRRQFAVCNLTLTRAWFTFFFLLFSCSVYFSHFLRIYYTRTQRWKE